MNNHKNKYLKYKFKYLELKKKLLIGGGIETARANYYKTIKKNYEQIFQLFLNDNYLKQFINLDELPEITLTTTIDDLKLNPTLNLIFEKINELSRKDIIDEVCAIYLNGKLGNPNSLENIGRYKDANEILVKLRKSKKDIQASFKSLEELENYVNSEPIQNIIKEIDTKKEKKTAITEEQKRIKELGEDDVEIILSNGDVTVYHPTTEAGAIFYGRGTRWCTAAKNNNMFNQYNEEGPMYIIQNNKVNQHINNKKFQIHLESNQLMNPKDESVKVEYVKEVINNNEFNDWIDSLILDNLFKTGKTLNIYNIINYPKFFQYVKSLENFNGPLDILNNFANLQELTFGYDFNEPLGKSLDNLINLEQLTFGWNFNQPLGTSLDNLTNLQKLTFIHYFNKPLGTSLDNLTNLQKLTFGNNFNESLDKSLDKLINLRELILGNNFNKPLEMSLNNLTNLQKLNIEGKFNESLGTSLNNLINLKELTILGNFNKSLGTSLDNLRNLEKLNLLLYFNQPLGTSLNNLTNLKELTLGDNFNQPLGTSLDNLTNLRLLTIQGNYDYPLETSLNNLANLKVLSIGRNYKYPLDFLNKSIIVRYVN
jgi:Leucine-rich repeat (LRR) protein